MTEDEVMQKAEEVYRYQKKVGNAYAFHTALSFAKRELGLLAPEEANTRTLQIAEKAVEEAKLNRLGYPDEMANRIARLAVDDMERDILSRIKTETETDE